MKYRKALILPEFEIQLYQYITGIIKNLGQFPIRVNGMPNHIHIAARLKPTMAPAVFVQKVKANSSKWINSNNFLPTQFAWQTGGGTFSISRTHVKALDLYISNQKAHHKTKSFKEEYLQLLEANDINADSDHLPDFIE